MNNFKSINHIQCLSIKMLVEKHFGVEDIGIRSRKEPYPEFKKIYCKLCRVTTLAPYQTIGDVLNNYDHASVLHNVRTFDDLYETKCLLFATDYEFLKQTIESSEDFFKNDEHISAIQFLQERKIAFIKLVEKYRTILKNRDNTIAELKKENESLTEKLIEYSII